jgi:hypothetical protein
MFHFKKKVCINWSVSIPKWSRNSVSRVLIASWSPSWVFGIKSLNVGADVSPGSSSSVIGIGVMHETYELSSSSYMVIKSMRTLGTPIRFDSLVILH